MAVERDDSNRIHLHAGRGEAGAAEVVRGRRRRTRARGTAGGGQTVYRPGRTGARQVADDRRGGGGRGRGGPDVGHLGEVRARAGGRVGEGKDGSADPDVAREGRAGRASAGDGRRDVGDDRGGAGDLADEQADAAGVDSREARAGGRAGQVERVGGDAVAGGR